MNSEKKSKRQERRQKIMRQERRNRLITIGLIAVGAIFIVIAVVYPNLKAPAEVKAIDPGTHPSAKDNSMGDPNAPITIEEFSDFQCPYCERFHQDTEPLLRQYYIDTGKVHFIYRSMGNFVSGIAGRGPGGLLCRRAEQVLGNACLPVRECPR
jgi:hypothetical protein